MLQMRKKSFILHKNKNFIIKHDLKFLHEGCKLKKDRWFNEYFKLQILRNCRGMINDTYFNMDLFFSCWEFGLSYFITSSLSFVKIALWCILFIDLLILLLFVSPFETDSTTSSFSCSSAFSSPSLSFYVAEVLCSSIWFIVHFKIS